VGGWGSSTANCLLSGGHTHARDTAQPDNLSLLHVMPLSSPCQAWHTSNPSHLVRSYESLPWRFVTHLVTQTSAFPHLQGNRKARSRCTEDGWLNFAGIAMGNGYTDAGMDNLGG
jgi:hypothetical protein